MYTSFWVYMGSWIVLIATNHARIIYRRVISSRERLAVQIAIPLGECTCGEHLFEKDSPYYDRIQPQLTLTESWGDPVEQACYSSEHINREYDICSFCAATGIDREKELEAKFRLVLPFCKACSQWVKNQFIRLDAAQ